MRTFRQQLARDLLYSGVLATVALCAGLAINQFRDKPVPLAYLSKQQRMEMAVETVQSAIPANTPLAIESSTVSEKGSPKLLGLQEFKELVEKKKGVILDARPEIFHRLGHVPGALSLSREAFDQDYEKYRALLEKDKSQPVAIYCSGSSCEDSDMVAGALLKLGYTNIAVFKGGWDEWTSAQLPKEGQG